jgi:hypothetical protein
MISTGLIAATGKATVPAFYMLVAALAAVAALALTPDRSRTPQR